MAKPIVYVTPRIPDAALDLLREHCQVEVNSDDNSRKYGYDGGTQYPGCIGW